MRTQTYKGRWQQVLAVAALLLCVLSAGMVGAQEAGRVVNLTGRALAATPQGSIRLLQVGDAVNSGEVVVTSANSLARIRFVDDAYVILRPNTRFQIEDYNYNANVAQDNRSVMRLLKGGMRTVTGLIGQRNRAGYQMRTSISTIGIRGTDFEVFTCDIDCPRGQRPGDTYRVNRTASTGFASVEPIEAAPQRAGFMRAAYNPSSGGGFIRTASNSSQPLLQLAQQDDGDGGIIVETDEGEIEIDPDEFGYTPPGGPPEIIPPDLGGVLNTDPLPNAGC